MTSPPAVDPAHEMVDLVDAMNSIVGQAPRRVVRSRNLLHRGVGIICFNAKGEIYVHQRTATKDVFPNLYDMLVGGVVSSGEAYDVSAAREVREELGIAGPAPTFLFVHLYLGPQNRSWIYIYSVVWDGPIRHQQEEIAWGQWMSAESLDRMLVEKAFVPDGLEVYRHYREWQSR